MTSKRYDVLALGNAIVDVLAHCDLDFIDRMQLNKGTMTLIDAERAEALYDAMGPAVEASGGRLDEDHLARSLIEVVRETDERNRHEGFVPDEESDRFQWRDFNSRLLQRLEVAEHLWDVAHDEIAPPAQPRHRACRENAPRRRVIPDALEQRPFLLRHLKSLHALRHHRAQLVAQHLGFQVRATAIHHVLRPAGLVQGCGRHSIHVGVVKAFVQGSPRFQCNK